MISKETYDAIMANKELLDSAIIYDRDFQYNYVSHVDLYLNFKFAILTRLHVFTLCSLDSRRSNDRTCFELMAGSPKDLNT